MKYLNRSKIYEKVAANKDAKKVYIICEGAEKERKYFGYFEGFSSNIDLIVIPPVDHQTDPIKLKEQAYKLFIGCEVDELDPKYNLSKDEKDEVWFVIDTDRWNEGDKIAKLKSFCDEQNSEIERWFVAQSNPCFEVWLYYHVHKGLPTHEEVGQYSSFKEFLNNVVPGGFDIRSRPMDIDVAITNASENFQAGHNGQPELYSTEVHNLGKVIYSFIGDSLIKAKQAHNIVV